MASLADFEKEIKVKFNNADLLQQAFVHRSYLNEHSDFKLDHNERLEFLGDAVLELVTTEYLYKNYPNPEGELTSFRASLVNSEMLSEVANKLGIEKYLLLSRGEAKDTGRARQYILANAFEAIVGAIYLDQGYEPAKNFIEAVLVVKLPQIFKDGSWLDPKSKFQEEAQEKVGLTPTYEVTKDWGPDHDKHFVVGVFLGKDLIAEGEGKSKQEAQRNAAAKGLEVKKWGKESQKQKLG